nr:VWA domain-containing protein [Fretibacterium sp.]
DRTVTISNEQNMRSPDSWQEIMEIQTSNTFEKIDPPDVSAKVVFIIDHSGSMSSAIDTVKARIKEFANKIYAQGVTDLKMGIATYDSNLYPVSLSSSGGTIWAGNLSEMEDLVSQVSLGSAWQNPYTAITEAVAQYDMSDVEAEGRHFVLITDTYNEGLGGSTLSDAQNALATYDVTLSAVSNGYNDITQLITSEGIDMRLNSNWGTTLTDELGKKIGEDAMKGVLFETTPLGEFREFTEVGSDGRKLFTDTADTTEYTIQVEQNGVSHAITIGAQDTLKSVSEKLQAALGSGNSIEIVPVLSENGSGAKVISFQTSLDADAGRVTYSGDPKMLAILGLRSSLDQKYSLDASAVAESDIHFRNFYLNSSNGTVHEGDVILTTNSNEMGLYKTLTTFEAAYVGQIARKTTQLRDLEQFWDSQGVCMLDTPQTLTLTQGDGKSVSVTLYANDTMNGLRSKLNDAIASGLGQGRYVMRGTSNFVSFTDVDQTDESGPETVGGTLLIRSVIPGRLGELSFSGSEDLMNALGLNTIQESSESRYSANIYDAHSGRRIASGVRVTGNHLNGIIHENVDVEFDAMSGIRADWNEDMKSYVLSSGSAAIAVHLADNGLAFQVGANMGEQLYVNIGNMSADALGITGISVATRESAEQSISALDRAINRVLTQRSKIGAYQNSLEYTSENLTTTATNLTAAESRIRDADMALMMMEFAKLQILNQSGTSMLAQANQLPHQVLSLLQ